MHKIQHGSNFPDFSHCGICKSNDRSYNLSEITCKTRAFVQKAIYHNDCLRKISFRENRGGKVFSCPTCSSKIEKAQVYSKIELIGLKILNLFASHLTLFKISSAILGSSVIVLAGALVTQFAGLTGLALFIIAEVGALLYGGMAENEIAISTVGMSDKVKKEAQVVEILYVMATITEVAVLSILGAIFTKSPIDTK